MRGLYLWTVVKITEQIFGSQYSLIVKKAVVHPEDLAEKWFKMRGWKPFPYQQEVWKSFLNGKNGLVNAPTGSGKTYSLLIPALLETAAGKSKTAVSIIWLSPVRALARQILQVAEGLIEDFELPLKAALRTGDTPAKDRKIQMQSPPDLLITTPESLHQWMANPKTNLYLLSLRTIIVDEWHELASSKRGVQTELAISWLSDLNPQLKIWAISATIGRVDQSLEILLGSSQKASKAIVIKSTLTKEILIETLLPEDIFELPWAGHIGLKMLQKVAEKILSSRSTLVFTNTRAQCEIWYQRLLEFMPGLAGNMAMHHSSIDEHIRHWVEEALHNGTLRVVVCTSSLDLGVDFRPVDLIIQIGGAKGVGRFMQRAGRSGHRPGMPSRICFVPTHAIELVEAAALRQAVNTGLQENHLPHIRSFDVLVQFMMTLAVGGGFFPDKLFQIVRSTHSYRSVTPEEWKQLVNILIQGGNALESYEEYHRASKDKEGKIRVLNKWIARRHLMAIGTITGDQSFVIKYRNGKKIGTVEEWFITHLKPGDVFWFAGRALELGSVSGNKVLVTKSNAKQAKVPAWMGGRMPLSSMMSKGIRNKLQQMREGDHSDAESRALMPLLKIQSERSAIPALDEFLIEYYESREGFHLLAYPFEGRLVHEGLAALLASRIASKIAVTFSIAMNDYGFELLSDRDWEPEKNFVQEIFSSSGLENDIQATLDKTSLAKRKFRDIAMISGLLFRGFPGREKKERHLQSSASLLYDVFYDYDPDHLLFRQAHEEVNTFQLEEARLRQALQRIQNQHWILKRPGKFTPLALPIIADRLRERLSSEKIEDRLRRMLNHQK
ncbi:MAG: ligase-associated DNA damage response DEXH box helicase [Saprospirales bacterium]|nr:MAG: ligase-associated DNA damage response DEXH box helicase [Saprospirales bacterium]